MPVRYTDAQDNLAFTVMMGSAIAGGVGIVSACAGWFFMTLAIAVPGSALTALSAIALVWSLRVQWRYAGQTEEGK